MILLGVAVALGYAGLFRLASYGEANVGWRWNRALAGVALWLGISGLLGASGIIAEFDRRPPPMLLIGVFLLGRGRKGSGFGVCGSAAGNKCETRNSGRRLSRFSTN
jgi:hypothetical protein